MKLGVFGARAIPSTYSGYETFLTTLLPEFVRRGHDVTMYCRAGWVEEREYEGVRLVSLPGIDNKQLSTLSHGMVASIVARTRRHDAVLVVNIANAPHCGLLRLTGQRVALNTDGQEWLRGKWGRAARSYFKLCAKYSSHAASALVSDCNAMKRIYLDDFGVPSVVIPYSRPEMAASDLQGDLRKYAVEPGKFMMVAARLNPENNIDRVAESFARSRIDFPLLVLGTANYASEVSTRLEAIAARDARIRVLGHVGSRADFALLLQSAAAYVHGHSVGGMNPSLLEAMSAGARIVALDTVFNREVVGGAGTYFELDSATQALHEVADEPSAATDEYRRQAFERATTLFSLDAVASAYELLLTEVAALRSARGRARVQTTWDATSIAPEAAEAAAVVASVPTV
jgi:glycosyltransferase involved in cell wall biosynthesis